MKSRIRWIALFAVLALGLGPGAAISQELTPDRVVSALDLTERRIQQAEQLLGSSDNERARAELALAVSIQAEARRAFANAQYLFANRLTLEARGHADRCLTILSGPDPDGVLAQLERTRDLLDRARDRIEECDHPRAHSLIRISLQMQARAEALAGEGRYLAALQLTVSARERGLRALRLCRLEEDLAVAAERALQRTDDLIGKARDSLTAHPNDRATTTLERAVETQNRARVEFGAGRFEPCLRLTQQARTLAQRSLRSSGGAL